MSSMNENDRLSHQFLKPNWSQDGLLIHKTQIYAPKTHDMLLEDKELLPIEDCSIRAAKVAAPDKVCFPS